MSAPEEGALGHQGNQLFIRRGNIDLTAKLTGVGDMKDTVWRGKIRGVRRWVLLMRLRSRAARNMPESLADSFSRRPMLLVTLDEPDDGGELLAGMLPVVR